MKARSINLIRKQSGVLLALSTMGIFAMGRRAIASGYVEATNFVSFDGEEAGTYLYNNLSYKLSDKVLFSPEMLNILQYRTAGDNKFNVIHAYLRLTLVQKEIAEVDGWKVGMTYRYNPPTTQSAQKSGSFGTLLFRPQVSRKFGDLAITIREGVSLFLQRNGYQINVPRNEAVGNPLIAHQLNPTIEYTLAPDFKVLVDLVLINQLSGPGPYGKGTSWLNELWQEYGFDYSGKALGGFGAGLTLFHVSSYGAGKDFQLFSRTASINLKINREF
ncbi:MAG: hypothetical protein JST16_14600 [Bdellovibrionales bacterium]|nr:hypothetical protein [Bdellovibrionales bacterium]